MTCRRYRLSTVLGIAGLLAPVFASPRMAADGFSIRDVLSAPFPSELTAAPRGNKAVWVSNDRGSRNLWVSDVSGDGAGGAHAITHYTGDDGVDIGELRWLPDASAVVYTRGGSFEGGGVVNALSLPQGAVEQELWLVSLTGAEPRKLGAGHAAAVASAGDHIAFISGDQIWLASAASGQPKQLIHDRGKCSSIVWSPDGHKLAFISSRGDHSFIGVYDLDRQSLVWMAPSVDTDDAPTWSPDSSELAFIRAPSDNPYVFAPRRTGQPWSIWVANAADGTGKRLWVADPGVGSVFFPLQSERQLLWSNNGEIIFPWEKTGWKILYAVSRKSGSVEILTPGEFEVVNDTLAPKANEVIYSANAGELDGRHLWKVSTVTRAVTPVSSGKGIEDSPDITGEGRIVALQAFARAPLTPVYIAAANQVRALAPPPPKAFPLDRLVQPQDVMITASDGMRIHAQLFVPAHGRKDKAPAVVFFHGGPQRQMFSAWNPMDAYYYMYGMNQYFASKGYVVLSVNYRGGVGYGLTYREAEEFGVAGASEHRDIVGAAQFLSARADVDAKRIGVYGASYGGLMTALALSRSSDLFAAGVDYAGVYSWPGLVPNISAVAGPDAAKRAEQSSPSSTVERWRSPVLVIHADDDRNVPFAQSVDLINALRKQGHVQVDELIIPNEIHDLIRHESWEIFFNATDRYFDQYLGVASVPH
jgi:dipeptidyl aminopeptidase/acylaminoacyl peptidase